MILVLFLSDFFYLQPVINVSQQIKNLSNGEYLEEKSLVYEGDILEREIIFENKENYSVKGFKYDIIDPFTENIKTYNFDLDPGDVKVILEKKTARKKKNNIKYKPEISYNLDQKNSNSVKNKNFITALKSLISFKSKNTNNKSESDEQYINKTDYVSSQSSSVNNEFYEEQIISVVIQDRVNDIKFWEIFSTSTDSINNNFDSFYELKGKNLNDIDELVFQCTLEDIFLPISLKKENFIQLIIPVNRFDIGICNIGIVKNDIVFPTSFKININKSIDNKAEVFLKRIVPNTGSVNNQSLFILTGKGFDNVVAVQIDNGIVLDLDFVRKISNTTMVVNIPSGLSSGKYYFRFLTANTIQAYPQITFNLY